MCVTCAQWAGPGSLESQPAATSGLSPAAADHHLHIQSPDISAELGRRVSREPERFSIFDAAILSTRSGQDALNALDTAGIREGVLLSMAYMFGSPRTTVEAEYAPALTRAENRWNVAAAAASRGRLKAFISVSPFVPYAIEEVQYWAAQGGATGLKLHLGNSDFHWRSDIHVAQLAEVFSIARGLSMPVIVHVRAGGSYSAQETRRFIDEVLVHARDNIVQIAHAGGEGGLDDGTLQALAMYADARERGAIGTRRLVFDLACVLVKDRADPQSAALLTRLASLVRRIGPENFLMGSDWPSVLPPKEHNAMLEAQLPLTSHEWGIVLTNRAGYLA